MDIDKIVAQVTEQVMSGLSGMGAVKSDIPYNEVAGRLEHSLLAADMTAEKMVEGCMDAKKYRFATVCATPYLVPVAASVLRDSGVAVCSAVGFPNAAASTAGKAAEIRECLECGAGEIDISLNICAVKSGNFDDVRRDLDQMVSAANARVKLKAIYEQGLYSMEERERVLAIIKSSGVNFVKISNVFSGKKACIDDVKFVRERVGRGVGIKIDGGVKKLDHAMALLNAGADRIGLTATVSIAEEAAMRK